MWIGLKMMGSPKNQRQQGEAGNRHVNRNNETHSLAKIVIDAPAEPDRSDDRSEIIIQQHDGGGFARDIRAAPAHGDANMRRFQ